MVLIDLQNKKPIILIEIPFKHANKIPKKGIMMYNFE